MKRYTILALLITLLAPVALAGELGTYLARLEGGWYGENNRSPMGPTDFAMVWRRQDDGSWRSRSVQNSGTWIDLKFYPAEDGRWWLKQAAALNGLGVQSSLLEPIDGEGAMRSWVDPERPEFLRVDLAVDEQEMYMKVTLRGEDHATFRMQRTSEEEAAEMLAEFAKNETIEPADQPLVPHGSDTPQGILDARGALIADPDSAPARVDLARAFAVQIQSDPASAALYAGEMLRVLQEALELDPDYPDTYEMLIGYYVNAPAFAGGSIDKAQQMAERLAELAPERAEPLQEMIAARR